MTVRENPQMRYTTIVVYDLIFSLTKFLIGTNKKPWLETKAKNKAKKLHQRKARLHMKNLAYGNIFLSVRLGVDHK